MSEPNRAHTSMGENGTDRTRRSWTGPRSMSTRVIEAVAAAEGVDPADLESLYEHLDPDALDALFAPTATGRDRDTGSVTFRLADRRVSAYSDGTLFVGPIDGE